MLLFIVAVYGHPHITVNGSLNNEHVDEKIYNATSNNSLLINPAMEAVVEIVLPVDEVNEEDRWNATALGVGIMVLLSAVAVIAASLIIFKFVKNFKKHRKLKKEFEKTSFCI